MQTPASTSSANVNVSTGMYLLGVNEDNVIPSALIYGTIGDTVVGTIQLSTDNVPSSSVTSADLRNPITVYLENTTSSFYVFIGGVKYYILPTKVAATVSLPKSFEFYLNPQHITPKYTKNITELRTRGGWDIQHWGDALTEVTVQGKTGGLNNSSTKPTGTSTLQNSLYYFGSDVPITQSTAWLRLNQLKSLYNQDHVQPFGNLTYKLVMNYYDKFYIGYFSNFSGPEADAMSPLNMTFAFTFKVEQEVSSSSFNGAIETPTPP
jgi:hypothetical protein